MFSGFFNYDNPVWRFIGKFWDIIVISFLWTVCSIPIVTIGASTTAMYYVTLKLVRDEDGYIIRGFFKSFRENFKQATVIWLIFLIVGSMLGGDLYFFMKIYQGSTEMRTGMMAVFCAFGIVYTFMLTYVFPLQARFVNTVKMTIFNSFFMSIRHFIQTLGMLVVDAAVVFLALSYLPFLMVFGVALIAFINSYFLVAVFNRYMPKEKAEEDELSPLFENDENND